MTRERWCHAHASSTAADSRCNVYSIPTASFLMTRARAARDRFRHVGDARGSGDRIAVAPPRCPCRRSSLAPSPPAPLVLSTAERRRNHLRTLRVRLSTRKTKEQTLATNFDFMKTSESTRIRGCQAGSASPSHSSASTLQQVCAAHATFDDAVGTCARDGTSSAIRELQLASPAQLAHPTSQAPSRCEQPRAARHRSSRRLSGIAL
jgi:hypothetical protein